MTDFFPTDVQVRSDGRIIGTQLLGEAKQMMFRANLMRQGAGDIPVQLKSKTDEGEITVLMYEGQKIITIHPTPKDEPVGYVSGIYLLCGMVRDGTVHIDPDTGKRYLRSFRPTLATATSRHIENAFADNERLCPPSGADGTNTAYVNTKASMYSGAMKRVAQAVQGLGKIDDSSGFYLTRPPATRYVSLDYDYTALRTHGIYKSGIRNHWLIEVSKANGVLAMPLPLIRSTVGTAYRNACKTIGDTGTYEVVNEFGGLPSGETFPTGAALATAITKGKVLQLLTAADMSTFYSTSRGVNYPSCGWAFSDMGYFARNTCQTYVKYKPGTTEQANLPIAEHWELSFNLTRYNLAPKPGDPVGTGSASLSRIHYGRLFSGKGTLGVAPATENMTFNLWTPNVGVENLEKRMKGAEPEIDQFLETVSLGGVIHTWFEDDIPRYMKWVYQWGSGASVDDSGLPHFLMTTAFVSPTAFVCGATDLRRIKYFRTRQYVINDICCGSIDVVAQFEEYRRYCAGGGYAGCPEPSFGATPPTGGICAMDDTELQKYIISRYGSFTILNLSYGEYWAFIPAYCREGVVLGGSFSDEFTPQEGVAPPSGPSTASPGHAAAYVINGIGTGVVPMIALGTYPFLFGYGPGSWFNPPVVGQYWAYGAMPGYGTTGAYIHTKYMQNKQTPDHQYVYNNTLDGAQLTPIGKLNFIGSIT